MNNISELAKAISKLRTTEEVELFLKDFLSPSEQNHLGNRWQILSKLSSKQNYQEIQKETGQSSATIAKMSTALKYGSGIIAKIFERLR